MSIYLPSFWLCPRSSASDFCRTPPCLRPEVTIHEYLSIMFYIHWNIHWGSNPHDFSVSDIGSRSGSRPVLAGHRNRRFLTSSLYGQDPSVVPGLDLCSISIAIILSCSSFWGNDDRWDSAADRVPLCCLPVDLQASSFRFGRLPPVCFEPCMSPDLIDQEYINTTY
jgi:hypothetical protein